MIKELQTWIADWKISESSIGELISTLSMASYRGGIDELSMLRDEMCNLMLQKKCNFSSTSDDDEIWWFFTNTGVESVDFHWMHLNLKFRIPLIFKNNRFALNRPIFSASLLHAVVSRSTLAELISWIFSFDYARLNSCKPCVLLYLSQNVGEVRKKRKEEKTCFFYSKWEILPEFRVFGLIISEFWSEQRLKAKKKCERGNSRQQSNGTTMKVTHMSWSEYKIVKIGYCAAAEARKSLNK